MKSTNKDMKDSLSFWGIPKIYSLGVAAAEKIQEKTGITPTVINPYYITGQDTELLEQLKSSHKAVITLEDGVLRIRALHREGKRLHGSTATPQ